jgi:hypothetical protein
MSQGQGNVNIGVTTATKQVIIFPGDYAAADEGSFFVSSLAATASTAVALTTQALADTNAALAIQNIAPAGINSPNLYLRYIKVVMTVVPGSNASHNYSSIVDPLTVKLTTTGTAFGTPQNVNTNSNVKSVASLTGGVNVAAALSTQGRRVGAGQVEGNLGVALDEWVFFYGPPAAGGDINGTVTNAKRVTVYHAPVVLAPTWWYTLSFWGGSQAASAATFSWEAGWIERPSGQ